jgi:hypothetical protein
VYADYRYSSVLLDAYFANMPLIVLFLSQKAICRGAIMRRSRENTLVAIHLRLEQANQIARGSQAINLACRTIGAMQAIRTDHIVPEVLAACETLDLSTGVSLACCEAFADAEDSVVLFRLIRACNRSAAHQELLR